MNFLKKSILLSLLFFSLYSYGQEKFTISGTVRDSANGESIIGASVWVTELSTGAATNTYGFYSLTLPAGKYTITLNFIGHQAKKFEINLTQNIKLNAELSEQGVQLVAVEVAGEKENKNVSSTTMSVNKLDMVQVKALPVLFGETDILKTLSLLPGIMTVGEGNTGFYVRGGGADQNLILLDEATVYNASHLLGFFSIFNADAIKDVTIYKGGIPAEYGGRLSSVLDVHMNDGNSKRLSVKGGIGLISSRLTVEGPIVKGRGSFILSGRRTYADFIFKPLAPNANARNSSLYFYDFNVKANYRLNDKNRLFLSGYFGRDVFNNAGRFGINWGNATGTLRWNHIFNDKLFANTSFIVNNYSYLINITSGARDFSITSSIHDYSLKSQFEYYLTQKSTLKFGLSSIYHAFTPGTIATNGVKVINDRTIEDRYGWENAVYLDDEYNLTSRLLVNAGLRFSSFFLMGPGKTFAFDSTGAVTDTTSYSHTTIIKPYYNLEPRVSARYELTDESSLKASYTRTTQYVQLLSNTTTSSPTDLWISSTNNIKPQIGDQYATGYFRNFRNNMIETSVEIYYKDMRNQIDYKPAADLILNPLVESQLYYGKGRAYGIEFFIKKAKGKFTGWISYTLSRTERQFDLINDSKWYPAKQDRTHDVSIVGTYDRSPKWTFGAVWVYATGNAVTFPVGKYYYQGKIVGLYTDRNGYRMPAYHRLDISITYRKPHKGRFESDWNFSVYNVYNRHNAYSIDFQQDPNDPTKSQALKTWLFGIVPSITYDFKF